MYTIHEGTAAPVHMGDEERQKIREQLDRLLDTHHFKNSRRYPALLRFIVEETLAGRGEFLKERLVGVRVFNRPADYDTATDPIVRVTIAEIRKRIAQYYHDEEHDAEIRIELQPGRYAAEFRARGHRREDTANPPLSHQIAEHKAVATSSTETLPQHSNASAAPDSASRSRRHVFWIAALTLLAITSAGVGSLRWRKPIAMDQMWSPLLASTRSILFCVPTDVGLKHGPATDIDPYAPTVSGLRNQTSSSSAPTFLQWEALGENVVFSDMLATLQIANVLAVHHHDYRTRLNTMTTLEDLRQGPAVLIGGLDNQWTMRALTPLRFHFAGSDEDRYWIADASNPGFKEWSLDLKLKYGAVTRDYAIIARLHNEQTGQPEVIVAGIGMSGTAAAGEFIGDPRRVEELRQRIGRDFKDHDFEAVLSTDVVNGIAGAPKIIAVAVF